MYIVTFYEDGKPYTQLVEDTSYFSGADTVIFRLMTLENCDIDMMCQYIDSELENENRHNVPYFDNLIELICSTLPEEQAKLILYRYLIEGKFQF